MFKAIFDADNWAGVPFHFWSVVFFIFGSIVGSFLNVCIHRMPLGQSIVSPPSHCPHCKYSIPWFLNVPLLTWLWLGGKCRNCGAPIAPRYFLVELLTGIAFLACWLCFGQASALLALVYCLVLAGLITATFIDFEHYIIPDEITFGGIGAGVLCSFLLPQLHAEGSLSGNLQQCILGIVVGGGVIYGIVRLGKMAFGRQKISLEPGTRLVFTETGLHLADAEIPYEEIFYRKSDTVVFHAETLELVDRCYKDVNVRLSLLGASLKIDDEELNPEQVHHLEAIASEVVLPREAMGLGDAKFMAAIGAFLGWRAVLFSLGVSSIIGATVAVTLIAMGKRERSSKLPFGPYIAMAAVIWIFAGRKLWAWAFPSFT